MKYIKRIDENFTVTETELNEAKKFYLIGNKEVSRDEVLSYKYSNPEKPVADRGWPKWLYTNNGPKGKTLEWSSIKKDMKDLEKKYGEGNVVVGGSTNAGGPYIEIYSKSQNESAVNEAKFDKKKLMKAVKGDDGIISTGDGKEYVIYKYGNGNDNNDDMWRDKSIFALDQDGEEHEIEYSDIVRYDESVVTEAMISSSGVKALRSGHKIKTQNGVYTITGMGSQTNATKDFEATNEKGEKFNLRVSLRGARGIQVAAAPSLNFPEKEEMLESIVNEAPMDKSFMQDWQKSCKALQNHVKHELDKIKSGKIKASDLPHGYYIYLNKSINTIKDAMDIPMHLAYNSGLNEAVNEAQFKVGDNVIVMRKDGKEYTGKVEKLNPLKLRISPSDTMVIPNAYIKDIVVTEEYDVSGISREDLKHALNYLDMKDISYDFDGKAEILDFDMTELDKKGQAELKKLGINESVVNEAKKFKPGDKWSEDFDYDGMLAYALKVNEKTPLKTLQKLHDSATDVNYHTPFSGLGNAIDWITDDGVNSQEGKDFMKQFHNDIKTEMKN
jgi:hypothetical protein